LIPVMAVWVLSRRLHAITTEDDIAEYHVGLRSPIPGRLEGIAKKTACSYLGNWIESDARATIKPEAGSSPREEECEE
jgi:hypothetical protein